MEYIYGEIYKSIFNKKQILIIQIDLEYLTKNKQPFELIIDNIKLIQKNCFSEYGNILDTYFKIENKIMFLNDSYDLFIDELKKRNIIDEKNDKKDLEKNKENDIKIQNDNSKINEDDSKNKNINDEKDINKEIEELKLQLNKEKEKIIEKDKEIKEIKLKLSRFPLTLDEGENLIIATFISSDTQWNYSVLCKNTDEFHKIEGLLYKENPQFTKNENYFLFNGQIIDKSKSLEQIGIKNNSQIIFSSNKF